MGEFLSRCVIHIGQEIGGLLDRVERRLFAESGDELERRQEGAMLQGFEVQHSLSATSSPRGGTPPSMPDTRTVTTS